MPSLKKKHRITFSLDVFLEIRKTEQFVIYIIILYFYYIIYILKS